MKHNIINSIKEVRTLTEHTNRMVCTQYIIDGCRRATLDNTKQKALIRYAA
jgi:hypothetical protein